MHVILEKFINEYREERDYFHDPDICFNEKTLTITPRKLKRHHIIGGLLLALSVPTVVSIFLMRYTFDYSIPIVLISFALIWFVKILKERINQIKLNNKIVIDTELQTVIVTPIDYLRKELLKKKSVTYAFGAINFISIKYVKFNRLNAGVVMFMLVGHKDVTLVNIETKPLGVQLFRIIVKLVKANYR